MVPICYAKLGWWVFAQRRNYKNGGDDGDDDYGDDEKILRNGNLVDPKKKVTRRFVCFNYIFNSISSS